MPKKKSAKKEETLLEQECVQPQEQPTLQQEAENIPTDDQTVQAQAALPPAASTLPVQSRAGTALDTAVPPIRMPVTEQERRNFWGRVLLLLTLGAVLAGAVFIFLYRPNTYSERTNSVKFLYNATENTTTVTVNGTAVGEPYAGACTAYSYDSDGGRCAALINGVLYVIDGREVRELYAGVTDFCFSQNGKVIAYRTTESYLYYAILGREVQTSLISKATADRNYCLSPDGKEMFYTYTQEQSVRVDIYSRTNSKPNFAKTTGLVPIAVGDGCKYIYYKDTDGSLFYMEGEKAEPVKCFASEQPYTLTFNRDFSQVLLDGALGTQLFERGERVVMPDLKTGEQLVLQANQRAAMRTLPAAKQYLIKSFSKNFYLKKGNEGDGVMLVWLGRKGELSDISFVDEELSRVTVTDKGVYYLEIAKKAEETQCYLFRCKSGKEEPERLSWENITEFCVNSDGSRLFYTDQHGALYAMAVEGVPDRLADTIDAGTLCVSSHDAFYYSVFGTLYVSDNGSKPRELGRTSARVFVDGYTAYFIEPDANGTFTVYANHRNRRQDSLVASGIAAIQ